MARCIADVWLGILNVFDDTQEEPTLHQRIEHPHEVVDTFEKFLEYDDVKEWEAWMLFGDDPLLMKWAEESVLERSRLCEMIWEDRQARRKLLTSGLSVPKRKASWDDFEMDTEGYWEYSDDIAADPVWVPFDDSWYGENEER